MTHKHTPGPWHVAGYKYSSPERIYDDVYFGNNKQNRICRLFTDDNDCQKANARLIAAAPELLAALQNALNVLAGIASGDLETVNRDSPAILAARAAIKNATGN